MGRQLTVNGIKKMINGEIKNWLASDVAGEIEYILKGKTENDTYWSYFEVDGFFVRYRNYEENYSFVIDVKGKPDLDFKQIEKIQKKYNLSDVAIGELVDKYCESVFWSINDYVEENYNLEFYTFGRSAGYWGFDLNDIKTEFIDFEKIEKKVEKILKNTYEDVFYYLFNVKRDDFETEFEYYKHIYDKIYHNDLSCYEIARYLLDEYGTYEFINLKELKKLCNYINKTIAKEEKYLQKNLEKLVRKEINYLKNI